MIDLRQTPEYLRFMESIGWSTERIKGINYYVKNFPIMGSFIKIQRPEKIDFQSIDKVAKKYRAFQIVIEPKTTKHQILITKGGFKQSRSPFIPAKTIQIDLTKSEKKLLSEMHYKTRYNIVKNQNSKIKIQRSKNINDFADFWQKCALKQRNMYIPQKKEIINLYKAFKSKAILIFGFKDGELISGILMIEVGKTAYYMYAASSDKGKKYFAPTLNVWESIKIAKKDGCKIFDFEGIYDERFPLNSWKGFTRFKKSFGGSEKVFPGTFVKYRLPI